MVDKLLSDSELQDFLFNGSGETKIAPDEAVLGGQFISSHPDVPLNPNIEPIGDFSDYMKSIEEKQNAAYQERLEKMASVIRVKFSASGKRVTDDELYRIAGQQLDLIDEFNGGK